MSNEVELAAEAQLLRIVASEAAEEPDAIERHPEILTVLRDLAAFDGLNHYFGGNGHDPNAYAAALADALEPYVTEPLSDAPELVGSLAFLAWALSERREPSELAQMQVFS